MEDNNIDPRQLRKWIKRLSASQEGLWSKEIARKVRV